MKKKELREKYKKLRSQLSNREQHQISQQIVELLKSGFDLAGKKISCFVPIIRFQEVNTWMILDSVDAHFYLPVIDKNDNLKHIRYEGKDKLRESSWGILEPQSGEETTADAFDMVLVPMLAISAEGYRVGYGKGYYDRFLATCRPDCLFIGLYQFETFEMIDEIHSADIPVHCCITPQGIHHFKTKSV